MMNSECVYRRRAGYQERSDLRLLSRTLPGHHLCGEDQEENPLLLLQPDCALPPHRINGRPWIHSPAWLGGKALPWWVSHSPHTWKFFFLQKSPSSSSSWVPLKRADRTPKWVKALVSDSVSATASQSVPPEPFQQSCITFPFYLTCGSQSLAPLSLSTTLELPVNLSNLNPFNSHASLSLSTSIELAVNLSHQNPFNSHASVSLFTLLSWQSISSTTFTFCLDWAGS